ncbi:hypothetical protein Q8A67_021015 [Cirrhinus molitorella]|uniref:Uncharacterized protein n=1 Tax=Cirrhinus molitorella TaxID=172907 RepID=A0AA88TEJ7_9TELE|nr:hypothetical protein Q8A67_021015 [Cirrhinus molitorella]
MEGGRELADLLLEFHFLSRDFGAQEQDGPEAEKTSTLWTLPLALNEQGGRQTSICFPDRTTVHISTEGWLNSLRTLRWVSHRLWCCRC